MTTRIECDFRHGLCDPMIARTPTGPVLSLVHGQESINLKFPSGLWEKF